MDPEPTKAGNRVVEETKGWRRVPGRQQTSEEASDKQRPDVAITHAGKPDQSSQERDETRVELAASLKAKVGQLDGNDQRRPAIGRLGKCGREGKRR